MIYLSNFDLVNCRSYVILFFCRSYSEVPWDTMLPRKSWPPTSTLEIRPDMVSHRFSSKKYEPVAEEWQVIGSLNALFGLFLMLRLSF